MLTSVTVTAEAVNVYVATPIVFEPDLMVTITVSVARAAATVTSTDALPAASVVIVVADAVMFAVGVVPVKETESTAPA